MAEGTKKESAKERILRVASDLFYREGIRAVGIDRIIAESGVAKASFYRNFATKDELIVAYLEQRHSRSMGNVEEAKRKHPDSPADQLYTLVAGLAERLGRYENRGCPFLNTAIEFPDTDHPGYRKAVECREELWKAVEVIARQAGARDPVELVAHMRMLSSGAIMISYMNRTSQSEPFLSAARLLIERQFA
ncbi:hypothetical protein PAESOLCIP111_03434 [Paenibacillus solanacearum]|uniref:HTH tetR-type domain-containing protein n=1 Tax=Paenibacillus solanacearum TaxID=2048548 RepID=A0A916NJD0_9BACL|nr:TetR/AcrR family transcriptional regulator [Paenibacillus solanacearum]CAG7632979.1 hypothetical protein PAESOLCIP111_03434 [Paenibacillus solanacearum]